MNPKFKPYFQQVNLLFFSLMAGIVITFLAFQTVLPVLMESVAGLDLRWMIYAGPISGLAVVILSNRLYQTRIMKARESADLSLKISEYRNSVVIRMIVLDFAAILNVFCFGFTGNYLFVGLAAVVLMLFVLYRPSAAQLVRDLQLEGEDARFVLEGE